MIQAGDKLYLKQYQTAGTEGGMHLELSDGSLTDWTVYDQNGQLLNEATADLSVLYRVADLSAFAGPMLRSAFCYWT